mgnify:CR=1 FL=1
MKTKVLYLFALTFSLTLSSCKKDPTPISTTITGKVVTFREDSLYYNGPIDVALYSSSMDWPIEKLETKTIYPPYNFEFITDYTDPIDKEFVLDVETNIPEHKWYYPSDGPWISRGGSHEIEIGVVPETTRQVRIINASQNSELIVNLYFCGKNYTYNPSYDGMERTITEQSFYHGWCSVDYQVHYTFTGTTITQVNDSIHTVPLDTVTYEIVL